MIGLATIHSEYELTKLRGRGEHRELLREFANTELDQQYELTTDCAGTTESMSTNPWSRKKAVYLGSAGEACRAYGKSL